MYKVGVHLIVEGRVQGVGFRYFSQKSATIHSINGYVKNLPDGNVEIVAEGENDNMNQFLVTIRNKHPFAHVLNIKKTNNQYSGKYKTFQIKY